MLWAQILENRVWRLGTSLLNLALQQQHQLIDLGLGLVKKSIEIPLCNQYVLNVWPQMAQSYPYGESFVGNVDHTLPYMTFFEDYLPEYNPPTTIHNHSLVCFKKKIIMFS